MKETTELPSWVRHCWLAGLFALLAGFFAFVIIKEGGMPPGGHILVGLLAFPLILMHPWYALDHRYVTRITRLVFSFTWWLWALPYLALFIWRKFFPRQVRPGYEEREPVNESSWVLVTAIVLLMSAGTQQRHAEARNPLKMSPTKFCQALDKENKGMEAEEIAEGISFAAYGCENLQALVSFQVDSSQTVDPDEFFKLRWDFLCHEIGVPPEDVKHVRNLRKKLHSMHDVITQNAQIKYRHTHYFSDCKT